MVAAVGVEAAVGAVPGVEANNVLLFQYKRESIRGYKDGMGSSFYRRDSVLNVFLLFNRE